MNIIFLDIDGVLNNINNLIRISKKTHKSYSGCEYPFDEENLSNLKHLVDITNSKIVITSSWRKHDNHLKVLFNKFKEYNLDKEIIGYTPILNTKRGIEIKEYLKRNNISCNFIILDDDRDMEDLLDHLILTSTYEGLTKEKTEEAIIRLSK